jgi:hypothetical protein
MDKIEPSYSYELDDYEYIGRAPGSAGWSRSSTLAYRCVKCGTLMPADYNDYFNCECGAMHLDIGYGRFGSTLGDHNILVYQIRHV